jgi:uncharacterized membrane protein YkvA (DUF1232 family)
MSRHIGLGAFIRPHLPIPSRMVFKLFRLIRTAGAGRLLAYVMALWKLCRHPQAPKSARWVALGILAYLVSPVDLVPDVVPLLGQLDDLVLVPLGVTLVSQLTPGPWQSCLREAERHIARWPRLGRLLLGLALLWGVVLVAGLGWWVASGG